ncbi:rRNA-processing protein Fcf1/Utp23 [Trinorchestia longiramus]|nr:rRNA-processing protein Fcf1/Utp23 [Trinorchestia longiramus]
MKIKRYKRVKATMEFYKKSFGFRPPYNVLIDGTFCFEAKEKKVKIREQLPNYLRSELNIVTTQCCIIEVENLLRLKKTLSGCCQILKQFPLHRCGHEGKPVTSTTCIMSLLENGNPHRYIVATNDMSLRYKIRRTYCGVPQIFMLGVAPTLEKIPPNTLRKVDKERNKLISDEENDRLKAIKATLGITMGSEGSNTNTESSKKKKKKEEKEIITRRRESN